jgi:UDP-N-acetylmuramoyl-L-alanyl-D-glutamate--2,6-diaminopimelate ligase
VDFAHTPDAMEKVLESIRPHVSGKLCVVFGCGGDRDPGKRALMGALSVELADLVVLTSDNPRKERPEKIIEDIKSGIDLSSVKNKKRVFSYVDRKEAISFAIQEMSHDDCVLILGKGHEGYQLIGTEKIPYSDFDVVEYLMTSRASVH